jgi:hypothetical protein
MRSVENSPEIRIRLSLSGMAGGNRVRPGNPLEAAVKALDGHVGDDSGDGVTITFRTKPFA